MGFQTQIRGTKHLFVGTDNITINTNPMAIGCGDWCESDWRNTPDFPFKSIFWSSLCVQCTCRGKLRIYTSCMCFIVPWPPKRGRLDCFVLLCCLSPVCTKSSKKAIGCQIKHVDFSFKWIALPQECEEIDKTPPTRTHIQKQQRSRNQAPPMKLCQGFPYKKEKRPEYTAQQSGRRSRYHWQGHKHTCGTSADGVGTTVHPKKKRQTTLWHRICLRGRAQAECTHSQTTRTSNKRHRIAQYYIRFGCII